MLPTSADKIIWTLERSRVILANLVNSHLAHSKGLVFFVLLCAFLEIKKSEFHTAYALITRSLAHNTFD